MPSLIRGNIRANQTIPGKMGETGQRPAEVGDDLCPQHAGLLHPPSAKKRVVVALRAYFDESGTHWSRPDRDSPASGSCDTFVLCGYIGTEALWDDRTPSSFEAKWNEVMHGKPFHAKEMESNPQGPDVKRALANLVRTQGVIGVGGAIHIPSYNKHLLPLIQQLKQENNPYLFLFADVIAQAVKCSEMFVGESNDEPIGFVFASHKKWSIEALQFYNQVKDDPETPKDVQRRMGAIAFEDMENFIPLQVADHLAFETYHAMNDPPEARRPAMRLLMDWDQNHGSYYHELGILNYIEKCRAEGVLP